MKKILFLIGATLLLHSCTELKNDLKKVDTNKVEQVAENAAEEILEEVIKAETGIDLNLPPIAPSPAPAPAAPAPAKAAS
jgi:hypothetical protein